MHKLSLKITDAHIEDGNLIITKMEVFDSINDESLRIAKITPELLKFLMSLEISVDEYQKFKRMSEINPNLIRFVKEFNCTAL